MLFQLTWNRTRYYNKRVFLSLQKNKKPFLKRFHGQSLTVLFNEIVQKRFCTSFVITKLAGRILYKFWKCLAGRIIYLRAGSMLSAGRIQFKIKKGLGAGHFHSAGRIRPAGRTLPTPSLKQFYKKILLVVKLLNMYRLTLFNFEFLK